MSPLSCVREGVRTREVTFALFADSDRNRLFDRNGAGQDTVRTAITYILAPVETFLFLFAKSALFSYKRTPLFAP